MFDSVLVANRGEIAVRVIRTLRRLGVRAVAVYSDADTSARHVRDADLALRIGPPPASASYLDVAAIIDAALRAGVDAIHPGYGFLSENAPFARACATSGIVFVGPPPQAIEMMGDKIRAKAIARESGVPVVPGRDEPGMSDADLAAASAEIGYPVLLKPSAGGGGKGMRLVEDPRDLLEAAQSARREARASFGDETLFVERFVEAPRHIEIQVFADAHGNAVHLGERECSLQRRHQKIIEEAPSPAMNPKWRASMANDALVVTRACGYVGAGTVEFIVPSRSLGEHYFLEMNTRLQVEHPVTELTAGVDLVEWQLAVASGGALPIDQADVASSGHAIEARVYAEDAARGFLPTGGRVLYYEEPEADLARVDSGVDERDDVTSLYDPLLAKVIAKGESRAEAIERLRRALGAMTVVGVRTNVAYLLHLLADPDVEAGRLDTGLAERALETFASDDVSEELATAATLALACELEPARMGADRWEIPDGWRISGAAWSTRVLEFDGRRRVTARWRGRASDAEVAIGDSPPARAGASLLQRILRVTTDKTESRYHWVVDGRGRWIERAGRSWRLRVVDDFAVFESKSQGPVDSTIRSPMPGSVVAVQASIGERVSHGDVLVVVEAMKMEHAVTAPVSGVVTRLSVAPGDRVEMDEELAVIEVPQGGPEAGPEDSPADGGDPS